MDTASLVWRPSLPTPELTRTLAVLRLKPWLTATEEAADSVDAL